MVVVVAAASKSSDTNKELRFSANFGCFLRAPVVVVTILHNFFKTMAALLLLLLLDFVVVT